LLVGAIYTVYHIIIIFLRKIIMHYFLA